MTETERTIRIERCPNPKCKSDDIDYGSYDGDLDINGMYMEQPCSCNDCGLRFTITRELTVKKMTVKYHEEDMQEAILWKMKKKAI